MNPDRTIALKPVSANPGMRALASKRTYGNPHGHTGRSSYSENSRGSRTSPSSSSKRTQLIREQWAGKTEECSIASPTADRIAPDKVRPFPTRQAADAASRLR